MEKKANRRMMSAILLETVQGGKARVFSGRVNVGTAAHPSWKPVRCTDNTDQARIDDPNTPQGFQCDRTR